MINLTKNNNIVMISKLIVNFGWGFSKIITILGRGVPQNAYSITFFKGRGVPPNDYNWLHRGGGLKKTQNVLRNTWTAPITYNVMYKGYNLSLCYVMLWNHFFFAMDTDYILSPFDVKLWLRTALSICLLMLFERDVTSHFVMLCYGQGI